MKATNKLVEEEELAERIDMFLFFLKHFLWVFKCKKIRSNNNNNNNSSKSHKKV